jgi:hypothetical protein
LLASLPPGRYDPSQLSNERLKRQVLALSGNVFSLRVPAGYRAILYDDVGFQGVGRNFTGDTRCFFFGKISSLIIEAIIEAGMGGWNHERP